VGRSYPISIAAVAAMVILLTALMEWGERALLAWSKGSTDLPG